MRAMVSGGGSFVGSALVRHLILNTACEVMVIDSFNPQKSARLQKVSDHPKYHDRSIDAGDREQLKQLLDEFKPQLFFHLAEARWSDGSIDQPDLDWENFGIWIDSDTDGVSDPGEFIPLDVLGIVEISLEYESTGPKIWSPNEDVLIHGETKTIFSDGSTVTTQDAEFKIENVSIEATEESFGSLIEQLIAIQNDTGAIQSAEGLDETEKYNDNESIEENTTWENLLQAIIKESNKKEESDTENEHEGAKISSPEQENNEQVLEDINTNEAINDLSTNEEEIDEDYM